MQVISNMDSYWIKLYLWILIVICVVHPLEGNDQEYKIATTPVPRKGLIFPKYAILFRGEEDTFEINISIPKNVEILSQSLPWRIEDISIAEVLNYDNETIEVGNYSRQSVDVFYSTVTVAGLRLGKTWLSIIHTPDTEPYDQVCISNTPTYREGVQSNFGFMSARRGRGSICHSDRHSDEDLTPTRQGIDPLV